MGERMLRTDWTRYHELSRQFDRAMERVEAGARRINRALDKYVVQSGRTAPLEPQETV